MTEVIYSIELDTLDTTGLTMVKVKMGKTSNLESRLNNYQTGMLGEPKVLDVWYPNPDVGLSSVENGVLDIAQQYSYNRNGEAFVFLQNGYQEFSETIDKLLEATTREKLEMHHLMRERLRRTTTLVKYQLLSACMVRHMRCPAGQNA